MNFADRGIDESAASPAGELDRIAGRPFSGHRARIVLGSPISWSVRTVWT